jgi:predicted HAD superfamily Cof-like phosphohydrolase
MTNFDDVKTFMKTFGQEVKNRPEFPSDKIIQLRYDLIKEELDEFEKAIKTNNLKEVADALTDILYVAYGAGHSFGINLDKCFAEVQKSNMSKLDKDGKPIYNDKGKVMKGPNFFEPNLKQFVK